MRMHRLWWVIGCGLLLHCGDSDDDGNSGQAGAGATAGSGGSGAATGGSSQSGGGGATSSGLGGQGQGGEGGQGQGGQGGATSLCDGPNPDGVAIVDLINAYRQSNGLPAVPYSPSLGCVAVTHVHDLADNHPNTGNCNLHSWSDQGPWTPCCYTPDHAQAQCMWDKPQELTSYPGYGYENAAGGVSTPQAAVSTWQNSSAHNDVILNQGIWASYPWGAVGAGLYQGYGALWFGVQADPAR